MLEGETGASHSAFPAREATYRGGALREMSTLVVIDYHGKSGCCEDDCVVGITVSAYR